MSRVVYDSALGRVCPACGQAAAACCCAQAAAAPTGDGVVRVRREVRNGKPMTVLIYKGNEQTQSFENVATSGGIAAALAPYAGYMFVLGAKSDRKRVFRVVEVQMDEEGEITVKAMEHPCDTSGSLLQPKGVTSAVKSA